MKPAGPVARRKDYRVEPCSQELVRFLAARAHYARDASRTAVHAHCLIRARDNAVVGAASWLPPTRVAAESVAGEHWRGVLSLSRLMVLAGEPKNAATLLLGASMRRVKQDRRWHTYLTYADMRQGHRGTIYQATNWTYLGTMPGAPAWIDAFGRQVAAKATRTRTKAEMLALGYTRLSPKPKHKYVFHAYPMPKQD